MPKKNIAVILWDGRSAKKKNTNKIYVCDIFINEFMQPSSRQYGRIHYNETVSFFCHTKQKKKTKPMKESQ